MTHRSLWQTTSCATLDSRKPGLCFFLKKKTCFSTYFTLQTYLEHQETNLSTNKLKNQPKSQIRPNKISHPQLRSSF